ncbi:hypothetical protein KEM54_001735 [Ascosphaera aggregata]|nr:hypothetical protein KEM54_001735 [Ascosphaera aggregata]
MVLSRLQQLSQQMDATAPPPHPFDPLTANEIEKASEIVRNVHGDKNLIFNTVTLQEPRKKEMKAWLANPTMAPRPRRKAEVIVISRLLSRGFDAIVDLGNSRIELWIELENEQPILSGQETRHIEFVARTDPKIIEQCGIVGIPPEDMHKVYIDGQLGWTIGYDERFGSKTRLQQALMYYRPHVDDCQYTYPLDFCPLYDPIKQQFVHIDIPKVRRPLSKAPPNNYHVADVEKNGGYRETVKPIHITQPEGVSFSFEGRYINWQNWRIHVGFNYREGLVLSDVSFNDKGEVRPIFYRLSLVEMVVPYGCPEHPHQRKHAFDLGEYGGGYLTNSLTLGCDCKGAIHYMDANFVKPDGTAHITKNAICIHEEDAGILFKHTDFRDGSVIVTRGIKLIISQVFTAGNYEYCIYFVFHMDGTIQLDVKLTGILNTYAMNPGEDTHGWGAQVYPGVNAHNHQHIFCMRVDPNLDGDNNTIMQTDAARGEAPVGSEGNKWGNAFYAKKTKFRTVLEGMADYDGSTSRTWDIVNENRINPNSGNPVSYKLVSRESVPLMPAPGSLVWNRAGFARHTVHVTPYKDDQLYPAGRHVPQTSGKPSKGLPEWIEENPNANIENTDIVLWHSFGITHFPAPEDFPIMPAEPMTLLLRPRHFFKRNPVLDVKPSYARTPSQVAAGVEPNCCFVGAKKDDKSAYV